MNSIFSFKIMFFIPKLVIKLTFILSFYVFLKYFLCDLINDYYCQFIYNVLKSE